MNQKDRKIIVAITGASGSVYAKSLIAKLSSLKEPPAEIAVILTETAKDIWKYETGKDFIAICPAKEYDNNTFYAPFASGSSTFDTMIICPASMGMTGRIANGISDDLISRAADVIIKEKRRIIIVPREAPYSLIHLRNMETLTLAGAVICPASPSFYSKPSTVDELVNTIVERIISLAGFESESYHWMENE